MSLSSHRLKALLHVVVKDWVRPCALFFLIVAPLKSAIVDWNWVPTGSMKPTILEGDLVLIDKLAYDLRVPFTLQRVARWEEPARGDVVVCFSPADGARLVKRVIALPGDVVEMRQNRIFLNGAPLAYAAAETAPLSGSAAPGAAFAWERLDERQHWVMAQPDRPALRSFPPQRVPAGQYFLLGDFRDNSHDSRFFGPVAREQIIGRARAVLVSFDLHQYLRPRLSRFFRPLAGS
ncbi:MAG TPA: signal peptidase I [Candidatus Synoicihabitans sp.]|nr:signal peptidase I [Candidatus Synoicihabitans sp.]